MELCGGIKSETHRHSDTHTVILQYTHTPIRPYSKLTEDEKFCDNDTCIVQSLVSVRFHSDQQRSREVASRRWEECEKVRCVMVRV